MAEIKSTLENIFGLIKDGKFEEIKEILTPDSVIDSPLFGRFKGETGADEYLGAMRDWLSEYRASVDNFNTIFDGNSIALEYTFFIGVGETSTDLPVALAGELADGRVAEARIYFSTWPLNGKHGKRKPPIKEKEVLQLPEPVKLYMNAISGTDPRAVVNLFDDSGYLREPSGSGYVFRGRESLMKFYTSAVTGGGIPLKHCNAITEGQSTAVEYCLDRWNGVSFDPQPGIAFYVTGENGMIQAARVYDDVEPPF